MTTNRKALYEQGVLRLNEPLPLPEGTQVDVTVTAQGKDNGEPPQVMDGRSWDTLTQLIADCEIDTGVTDLSSPTRPLPIRHSKKANRCRQF